jgi:Ca2+-binding RTX toxin-like protein
MAVYRFSALSDGQSVTFRPTIDVLNFDQSSISAADIRVTASGAHTRIAFGSKDILLLNTTPFDLATSNVTFASGSLLLIGDNSTSRGDDASNSLIGGSGRDHLIGYGGNDSLDGGAGADRLDGGLGNDTYVVGAGDVLVDAGGVDSVFASVNWSLATGFEHLFLTGMATQGLGNNGHNIIGGNVHNNIISGRGGNDVLSGHGGNDTFNMSLGGTSSYGADFIDGGDGLDTIDFGANALSGVAINLDKGLGWGGGSGGSGTIDIVRIENIVGGAHADWISGDGERNFFFGGGGNDSLLGGLGSDTLEGGAGDDHVYGGDGMDAMFADVGNDTMLGDADNDNFYMTRGGASYGNDVIDGGPGHDNLVFDSASSGIVVDLLAGTLRGGGPSGSGAAQIFHIEGVTATPFADRIAGLDSDDYFIGWDGNDVLVGRAGRDNLEGASGADWISGGDGDDVLRADGRSSRMSDGAVDSLVGGLGNDQFYIGSEDLLADEGGRDDIIVEQSWTLRDEFENLFILNTTFAHGRGNAADNHLTVWDGEGFLEGLEGADTVFGSNTGDDTLFGGGGNDVVAGIGGSDQLHGDAGNDSLWGGLGGFDIFVFAAAGAGHADEVNMFDLGVDKLAFENGALTAIGAAGNFGDNDARFYAAAGATSAHDQTDRLIYDTSTGNLYYDADGIGGGAAEIVARIVGAPALAASDITVI